jgi:hypothetical protein
MATLTKKLIKAALPEIFIGKDVLIDGDRVKLTNVTFSDRKGNDGIKVSACVYAHIASGESVITEPKAAKLTLSSSFKIGDVIETMWKCGTPTGNRFTVYSVDNELQQVYFDAPKTVTGGYDNCRKFDRVYLVTDGLPEATLSQKPMKLTLNDALAELKNGNVSTAWEIAQQDEGLNEGITKEAWLEFAYKTLESRGALLVKKSNDIKVAIHGIPDSFESLISTIEPILLKLEEKIGKVQGVIYENNSVVIHSVNQYENRDKYRDARRFLDSIGVNSWCSGLSNLMICL